MSPAVTRRERAAADRNKPGFSESLMGADYFARPHLDGISAGDIQVSMSARGKGFDRHDHAGGTGSRPLLINET